MLVEDQTAGLQSVVVGQKTFRRVVPFGLQAFGADESANRVSSGRIIVHDKYGRIRRNGASANIDERTP